MDELRDSGRLDLLPIQFMQKIKEKPKWTTWYIDNIARGQYRQIPKQAFNTFGEDYLKNIPELSKYFEPEYLANLKRNNYA